MSEIHGFVARHTRNGEDVCFEVTLSTGRTLAGLGYANENSPDVISLWPKIKTIGAETTYQDIPWHINTDHVVMIRFSEDLS
jgi:hypothetical protein